MARFIDTHTHIYGEEFDSDRSEVIERALSVGVEKMLLPNVDAASVDPMLQLCAQDPEHFSPMMGLHPTEIKEDYKKVLQTIESALSDHTFVGIGEIGLDYYWDRTFEKQQKEVFELQLDWAKQLGLPVSIHTRDAFDDLFAILEKKQDGSLRGVLHCFNGTFEQAKIGLDFGFYLGLGGVITYKNCAVKDFLGELPLSRLLLETDAPYLPPVPYRGKRNEPSFILHTAQRIAEVRQTDLDTIATATSDNARLLFGLKG